MKFYQKKLRKNSKYIKYIKELYRLSDIRYRIIWNKSSFSSKYRVLGTSRENFITLYPYDGMTIQSFINTAFHELGHVIAYRRNAYMSVHSTGGLTSRKICNNFNRNLFKAEKYVDALGFINQKIMFPSIPYDANYWQRNGKELTIPLIKRVRKYRDENF